MATTTDLTTLKINYLTQAQYDEALSGGTINENEIYLTPSTITLNGTSTTSPSFYAPTSAGTWGQVLTSSGNGAPNWTTPGYLPLSGGTVTGDTTFNETVTLNSTPTNGTDATTKQYVDNLVVPKDYYFGGTSNTTITASSNLNSFAQINLTLGAVSTSNWTVTSGKATTSQTGVYQIGGHLTYAPSSSSSMTSFVARLHVGSTVIVSRGLCPSGGTATIPIGPVIMNISAGAEIYLDCAANTGGTTQSSNNMSTITAVRIG